VASGEQDNFSVCKDEQGPSKPHSYTETQQNWHLVNSLIIETIISPNCLTNKPHNYTETQQNRHLDRSSKQSLQQIDQKSTRPTHSYTETKQQQQQN